MDLLGLIIFFLVVSISTPLLVNMQQKSLMELRSSATATQFNEIAKAANDYITTNYNNFTQTPNTDAIGVSITQLQQSGFLDPSISTMNPYGQTWSIQITQPTPGTLQGIVTANGGLALNQEELGSIIAQTHGDGGEVLPRNTNINDENDSGTVAYGAYGGWTLNLAGYKNPGPGHIVGLLNYYNGENLNNDYLYRAAVPGHPELNTMQSNIDMGNNGINNVNTIQTGQPTTSGCSQNDQDGHCVGQIMAASTSETALPTGWNGGVVTRDLYSQSGTIAVGPGAQNTQAGQNSVLAAITDNGLVDANVNKDDGGALSLTTENGQYSAKIAASTYDQTVQSIISTPNVYEHATFTNNSGAIYLNQTNGEMGTNDFTNLPGWDGYNHSGFWADANGSDGSSTNGAIETQVSGPNGPETWVETTYYPTPNSFLQSKMLTTSSEASTQSSNQYNDYAQLVATSGANHQAYVQTSGYVKPGNIANSNAFCPVDGELGSNSNGDGELFSCINNVWQGTENKDFNFHNSMMIGNVGGSNSLWWSSPFNYPVIVAVQATCRYSDGGIGSTVCSASGLCWVGFAEGQYAKGYGQSFSFSSIVPANGGILVSANGTCNQNVYAEY